MHPDRQKELENKIAAGSKIVDDYFDLAEIYFFNGMFHQAIEILEKLRNVSLTVTDQAHFYQQKAESLLSLGKLKEAEANYRSSLEVLTSHEDSFEYIFLISRAHYTLSTILENDDEILEHSKDALKFLSRALSFELPSGDRAIKHSMILSWMGDMHSAMGNLNDALRAHSEALSIASQQEDIVGILLDMAVVHKRFGNFQKAEDTFRKAILEASTNISTTKIYYEMGKMYLDWNKFKDAINALTNAYLQLDSDMRLKNSIGYETSIIWYIGFTAYTIGDGNEAIRYMRKVLEKIDEQDPFYAESHLIIAHQYYKDGDSSKAREHYSLVAMAPQADHESIQVAKKYLATIPLDS